MTILKRTFSIVLPIAIVAGLLFTLGEFKHTETLTPQEQEQIDVQLAK
ncbi:CapE family protein [Priestia endophytica]|nr:CapE family protein [Priestia endophytica]